MGRLGQVIQDIAVLLTERCNHAEDALDKAGAGRTLGAKAASPPEDCTPQGALGLVSQAVSLVAGVAQGAGVGGLDSVTGKPGKNLASSGVGILRQRITVAEAGAGEGHMQLL